MTFITISILALVILGIVAAIFSIRKKGENETPIVRGQDCTTCSGDNDKCEQECTMEAATRPIEYFDDEELDTFAGRSSDRYDDDEIEQFAYILHTMKPEEVSAWMRSLTLRSINLPDELKDEVMMLLE